MTEPTNVLEAMDMLSSIAESKIEVAYVNEKEVGKCFLIFHKYLLDLLHKKKENLKEPKTQKGVLSMILLADEVANKLSHYTDLFHASITAEDSEYQTLKKFYAKKIARHIKKTIGEERAWNAEISFKNRQISKEKAALIDIEVLRRDRDYELLFLVDEDESPFFTTELIRHIRLIGQFDEMVGDLSGEDPFVYSRRIYDGEVQHLAQNILKKVRVDIDLYSKLAMQHKEEPVVANLNMAIMALIMAASPNKRLEMAKGKGCLNYYANFQSFLRDAVISPSYPALCQKNSGWEQQTVHLSRVLASAFFTSELPQKESLFFLHRLLKMDHSENVPYWNSLFNADEALRDYLQKFPNGPVLQALEILRSGKEREGFDPIANFNFPKELYTFKADEEEVSVLHLPAPLYQEVIDKAAIIPEFYAFLHASTERNGGKKHLLFNLQDRDSWKEHARAIALERMGEKGEASREIEVITLPVQSNFYWQREEFEEMQKTDLFIATLLDQFTHPDDHGFHFPKGMLTPSFLKELKSICDMVISENFKGKKTLAHEERLCFLDLFYFALIFLITEEVNPLSISFTSKDGVDEGSILSAAFYAYVQARCKEGKWREEQKNNFLWMLYSPALFVRERAPFKPLLHRYLSTLSRLNFRQHFSLD